MNELLIAVGLAILISIVIGLVYYRILNYIGNKALREQGRRFHTWVDAYKSAKDDPELFKDICQAHREDIKIRSNT